MYWPEWFDKDVNHPESSWGRFLSMLVLHSNADEVLKLACFNIASSQCSRDLLKSNDPVEQIFGGATPDKIWSARTGDHRSAIFDVMSPNIHIFSTSRLLFPPTTTPNISRPHFPTRSIQHARHSTSPHRSLSHIRTELEYSETQASSSQPNYNPSWPTARKPLPC